MRVERESRNLRARFLSPEWCSSLGRYPKEAGRFTEDSKNYHESELSMDPEDSRTVIQIRRMLRLPVNIRFCSSP